MADQLPEPASRKELYLAKAAGMDVDELPKPASRIEEYLNAIADGGGGGGGYVLPTASADTLGGVKVGENLSIDGDGVLSATGGGGGDTVYSDKNTSNSATGGAVYIGNLDATQAEQPDPSTTDNHRKYFWALPMDNSRKPNDGTINILGGAGNIGGNGIVLGGYSCNSSSVAIGQNSSADGAVSIGIGINATGANTSSVSLGAYSRTTRNGEINVGSTVAAFGYDNTTTRVIGGVHAPVNDTDAANKAYVDGTLLDSSMNNYPAGNPTGICGWQLADGKYRFNSSISIYGGSGPNDLTSYQITGDVGEIRVYTNNGNKIIRFSSCEAGDFYEGYTYCNADTGSNAAMQFYQFQ